MSDPTIPATTWRYAATYPRAFWLLDARLAWPVLLWLAHLSDVDVRAGAGRLRPERAVALSGAARADGAAPGESRPAGVAAPAAQAPAAVRPMNRRPRGYLMALLLLAPASAGAEASWLDAEVRAQEARWAAQRGRTAPLQAVGTAALANAAPPTRNGKAAPARPREKTLTFPSVALRSRSIPPAGESGTGLTLPTRARPAETGGVARTILASARQHALDPLLVRAVILTESAGQRRARSPKGAMGLMQLMPATARRFGVVNA